MPDIVSVGKDFIETNHTESTFLFVKYILLFTWGLEECRKSNLVSPSAVCMYMYHHILSEFNFSTL